MNLIEDLAEPEKMEDGELKMTDVKCRNLVVQICKSVQKMIDTYTKKR